MRLSHRVFSWLTSPAALAKYNLDIRENQRMARKKDEAVTASFHFLQRTREGAQGGRVPVPFTNDEFDALCSTISKLPPLDLSDRHIADRVRLRFTAPMGALVRINSRTAFGQFESSYWGHAYKNSEKGTISAESISLRPFFYVMYLADNGTIYLGSQYLGLFGGYTALRNTIVDFLGGTGVIQSHAIRLGAEAYKNARPIAVSVEVSNRGKTPGQRGSIGNRTAVVFKKASKEDGFEAAVAGRIFPALDQGRTAVKNAVAGLMNESDLMTISESDIEDATIIAMVGKQRKTIHLIETGTVATRFHLDVDRKSDGHPVAEQTQAAMIAVLRDEVLGRRR
jgi:hypothetical protein